MSTKSENAGIAYFSDGHTEPIVDFEITKDGHKIWFTLESGRWLVHQEELVCDNGCCSPEYKFYEVDCSKYRDDGSEFGEAYSVKFVETDEIEKIRILMTGGEDYLNAN